VRLIRTAVGLHRTDVVVGAKPEARKLIPSLVTTARTPSRDACWKQIAPFCPTEQRSTCDERSVCRSWGVENA
jgi:hypothetical protein